MRTANEYISEAVSFASNGMVRSDFVDHYIALRNAEKRIYTDEAVQQLPYVEKNNLHAEEWKMRSQSSDRLIKYLKGKNKSQNILEVGCGNGWLSSQLARKIENANVTALDINLPELEQGMRVFKDQHNLHFVLGDIRFQNFGYRKFDVIIFAASIQYFRDFTQIINTALDILHPGGEIHILDSQFYGEKEVTEAKKRSVQYFKRLGFENMGDLYFHHSLNELEKFKYVTLYNPRSIPNRLLKNRNPFKWICIKSMK